MDSGRYETIQTDNKPNVKMQRIVRARLKAAKISQAIGFAKAYERAFDEGFKKGVDCSFYGGSTMLDLYEHGCEALKFAFVTHDGLRGTHGREFLAGLKKSEALEFMSHTLKDSHSVQLEHAQYVGNREGFFYGFDNAFFLAFDIGFQFAFMDLASPPRIMHALGLGELCSVESFKKEAALFTKTFAGFCDCQASLAVRVGPGSWSDLTEAEVPHGGKWRDVDGKTDSEKPDTVKTKNDVTVVAGDSRFQPRGSDPTDNAAQSRIEGHCSEMEENSDDGEVVVVNSVTKMMVDRHVKAPADDEVENDTAMMDVEGVPEKAGEVKEERSDGEEIEILFVSNERTDSKGAKETASRKSEIEDARMLEVSDGEYELVDFDLKDLDIKAFVAVMGGVRTRNET